MSGVRVIRNCRLVRWDEGADEDKDGESVGRIVG